MKLTRRRFFGATVATYVTTSVGSAATATRVPAALSAAEFATFSAYVDTLIPADRHSPAASALDVPYQVIDEQSTKPAFVRLIKLGCRWLDRRARASGANTFAALDDARRELIVDQTSRPTAERLPNAFFTTVRYRAMTAYYARADGWGGLRYDGPPQPNGFMDYHRPPDTRRR